MRPLEGGRTRLGHGRGRELIHFDRAATIRFGSNGAQSRWMSFLEAMSNVGAGYGLAVLTQIVAFPVFGINLSIRDNLLLGGIFTAISILRSYTLRRLFERLRMPGRA